MSPRDVIAGWFAPDGIDDKTKARFYLAADKLLAALGAAGYKIIAVKRVERKPFVYEDDVPEEPST